MKNSKFSLTVVNNLVLPLRALYKLTQKQFAAKLGVTVVTVNRWENDRTKPTPLAIRQLWVLLMEISQSKHLPDYRMKRWLTVYSLNIFRSILHDF